MKYVVFFSKFLIYSFQQYVFDLVLYISLSSLTNLIWEIKYKNIYIFFILFQVGFLDSKHIKQTLTYSLYGVAGLSSLILIGAFIAMCQRSIVISGGGRSYDEDGNESDESEQHNYHSLSSNPVVAPRSGGDGRRAVSRGNKRNYYFCFDDIYDFIVFFLFFCSFLFCIQEQYLLTKNLFF